ncbi:MAG: hypothetical protein ACJA0K_000401 [Maricaulis maris]|jgi:hypothetical protein|uniref:Uncharacterized protein n=2 Tax=Maricaulaceae TaxID=2800061 RepID=Q0AM14_MARMM|nr:conserved hypothetical protein [Maricaulis maris MCS10]MAC88602.1 hypothetical protein [Maricaulis sp.]
MAGGGDNGVLLGMTAANQAQRRGGRGNGGGSMFNVFPLLIIPVVIYTIVAYTTGADMSEGLFEVNMVSGTLAISKGDLLVILGMIMLFMELIKAAGSGTATIINHGLSMMIFVIAMALFLLVGHFATSTFFLLTLMALMDTVAGFVVTIVAARRDLAVGGEG